jgi:TatD DNase family protein
MAFLNFHTHQLIENTNERSVFNIILGKKDTSKGLIQPYSTIVLEKNRLFSVGLHPWFLDENDWQQHLQQLAIFVQNPNCVAIGECGIDRLIDTNLDFQKKVFEQQLALAYELKKPVIVHCVRAFEELLAIRKRFAKDLVLVVHGFNNKATIAQELLKSGCYFSLGKALLNPQSNAVRLLKKLPLEKLFLETDDSAMAISEIFEFVSRELDMSNEVLQQQIWHNFEKISPKNRTNETKIYP